MDSIITFKAKLDLLNSMLKNIKSENKRIQQIRRSVYVLNELVKDGRSIPSPYGPPTPIARFSKQ